MPGQPEKAISVSQFLAFYGIIKFEINITENNYLQLNKQYPMNLRIIKQLESFFTPLDISIIIVIYFSRSVIVVYRLYSC